MPEASTTMEQAFWLKDCLRGNGSVSRGSNEQLSVSERKARGQSAERNNRENSPDGILQFINGARLNPRACQRARPSIRGSFVFRRRA